MRKVNFCFFILMAFVFNLSAHVNMTPNSVIELSDNNTEVIDRLFDLNLPVRSQASSRLFKHIDGYTVLAKAHTEKLVGKSMIYFPIFEYYLDLYDLPEELKYLPVVESALNPKAVSHCGAAGLWQLMPLTAKDLGLKINRTVDERLDPYKSTEAAVKYLAKLYKRFDDWNLAIAAYNCGGTTVKRAMNKGKSSDFYAISKYLPKETQQYVPKFIGATYAFNYYKLYDLNPVYPDVDLQETETITLYKYKTLHQLSEDRGISLNTLRKLNPSYKRGIVPSSKKGNNLIVPFMIEVENSGTPSEC